MGNVAVPDRFSSILLLDNKNQISIRQASSLWDRREMLTGGGQKFVGFHLVVALDILVAF